MMTVSQKNASGQEQPVSLVMVSAKGRVAVYDVSLKLAAAFTLRLSFAPVASIKAPLSIPSATGTSASSRPAATPTISSGYNTSSSQKVFFFFFFSNTKLNYNAHSILPFFFFIFTNFIFFSTYFFSGPLCISTCEKNVMIFVKRHAFCPANISILPLDRHSAIFLTFIYSKERVEEPASAHLDPLETLTWGFSQLMISFIA